MREKLSTVRRLSEKDPKDCRGFPETIAALYLSWRMWLSFLILWIAGIGTIIYVQNPNAAIIGFTVGFFTYHVTDWVNAP